MLNLTQTQVFGAPPYNFSSQNIGFTNFAILAGALVGLFTAGPLSDWIAMRLTIRNNGIREPEFRLLTLIPYTILLFVGQMVNAFGYQNGWSWAPIVVVGYSFIGCQVTAIPAIVIAYAVDSYRPIAGESLVSATVNKNVWGYGVSKFVTAWIASSGYIQPLMINNMLTIVWILFGIPLYFYGKSARRWTKNSYVHHLQ